MSIFRTREVAMTGLYSVLVDGILKTGKFAVNNGLFKISRLFEGKKWRVEAGEMQHRELFMGLWLMEMCVSKNETDSKQESMSVLFCNDDGSSFVCWFDDNVAIGLESTDSIALCLDDVLHCLLSLADKSGIHAFSDGLSIPVKPRETAL
eukprot:g27364.t1